MFPIFVLSCIAALIFGIIGIFDVVACIPGLPNISHAEKRRLLRGISMILIPSMVVFLLFCALFL